MSKKQRKMLIRIIISTCMLVVLILLPSELFSWIDSHLFPSAGRWLRLALYLIDYLIIGHDILKKAWKGIRNRQIFDENFLMSVATLGALSLAIYENGDYMEAIAVMLLYQIGEWVSKLRSRKKPQKHHESHGHSTGLCQYRTGWETAACGSRQRRNRQHYYCATRRKSAARRHCRRGAIPI